MGIDDDQGLKPKFRNSNGWGNRPWSNLDLSALESASHLATPPIRRLSHARAQDDGVTHLVSTRERHVRCLVGRMSWDWEGQASRRTKQPSTIANWTLFQTHFPRQSGARNETDSPVVAARAYGAMGSLLEELNRPPVLAAIEAKSSSVVDPSRTSEGVVRCLYLLALMLIRSGMARLPSEGAPILQQEGRVRV
jgi:hypothetical protein